MLVGVISNVAVLAFDGVAPFELGVLHEAWGYDRSDEGLPVFDFAICAPQGRPVRTQAGFGMTVEHDLGRAAEADLIAVPAGADGYPVPECVHETLREGLARGARIMSLCTGAFVLGEAGLLDGRSCTTHWRHSAALARRFPLARVLPEVLYVDDVPDAVAVSEAIALARELSTDESPNFVNGVLGNIVRNKSALSA